MIRPTQEQIERYYLDGIYVAKGLLDAEQLAKARACYDWGCANPGPEATIVFPGTKHEHFNQLWVPGAWEAGIGSLVDNVGLGEYCAALWDSKHAWFFGDEYFHKSGGQVGNSPWHQDNSVIPSKGSHWVNFWISFERLPARNSLAVVRGSHRDSKLYNGAAYKNPDNPTEPLYPDSDLERLPDIDADLSRDPSAWDLVSFDCEPGDVIVFHPGAIHGGAPVDAVTPERHTLALRFFGDNAVYSSLPHTDYYFINDQTDGAPFRSDVLPQVY